MDIDGDGITEFVIKVTPDELYKLHLAVLIAIRSGMHSDLEELDLWNEFVERTEPIE